MLWKIPPRIKVYEALGALADGRVELLSESTARVFSSARVKAYDVTWNFEKNEIGSNDNGSYWQKYLSYPGLAVLMKLGKLPYREEHAQLLKDISWGTLNEDLRRDYAKVEEYVLSLVVKQGGNRDELFSFVSQVLAVVSELALERPLVLPRPPR